MAWLSLVLLLAAPARAQRLMSLPLAPIRPIVPAMGLATLAPMGFSAAPALSLPSAPLLQAPPLVMPPQVREALSRPVLTVPQGLVQQAGADVSFTQLVRSILAEVVPQAILADIRKSGYSLLVKDHLTEGRPDFKPFLDYTGGVTDWGPLGNFIMVAQRMRKDGPQGPVWIDNLNWRNSAVHECGHALDNINGFTDTAEFRRAWEQDVRDMPEAVKAPLREDGSRNDFYYFLNPATPGYAQRETFAEGFDILLRGEASAFNHDDFHRYFPRTLAVMRRMLEARYGPIVVESAHAD